MVRSDRDDPRDPSDASVPGDQLDPEAYAERRLVPPSAPDRSRGVGRDRDDRGPDRRRDARSRTSPRDRGRLSAFIRGLVGLDADGPAVVPAPVVLAVPDRTVPKRRTFATRADLVRATDPVEDVWYAPDSVLGPVVLVVASFDVTLGESDVPVGTAYAFADRLVHPIAETELVAERVD